MRAKADEVCFHRCLERSLACGISLPHHACHIAGVSCMAKPPNEPQAARRYGDLGTCPRTTPPEPAKLWSASYDRRAAGAGTEGRTPTHRSPPLGRLGFAQSPAGQWMRENDIKIIRTQKYKATTDSNHTFNIAPNLLDQDFSADGPNQKWAGDISYIWTSEGWLYLAVILDLYSRRVIGWAVSNRMKRDLAIRALDMAVALRQPAKGCIHHTDRGSQYCSHDYQKRVSKHGFKVSMSGKGNCYPSRDHAAHNPAGQWIIPWWKRSLNPSRQS